MSKKRDFVNIVATQNKINIATDKSIEKKFHFFVNKNINEAVSIEVLSQLLDENGYALNKQNNDFYIIKSKDDMLINKIKIYRVKYVDTQKLKEKVDEILKGYFKDVKTVKNGMDNKKVLTPMSPAVPADNNVNVNESKIEEKFNYTVNVLDKKSIAVTYKDLFVPDVVKDIVQDMDKEPIRIKVTAKIYEVNTNALKQFSSKLSAQIQGGGLSLSGTTNSTSGDISSGLAYNSSDKSTGMNLGLAINALESQGSAKLLSEPSLFLYEDTDANITNGHTYPVAQNNTITSNNVTTTSTTYQNINTGLTMSLNFKEYKNDFIYLDMNLMITSVDNYNTTIQQIITSQKTLSDKLMIKPDAINYLGGIIIKNINKSNGGIPLLQDLPYVGGLFKFKNDTSEEDTLIIELTASIVSSADKEISSKSINFKSLFKK